MFVPCQILSLLSLYSTKYGTVHRNGIVHGMVQCIVMVQYIVWYSTKYGTVHRMVYCIVWYSTSYGIVHSMVQYIYIYGTVHRTEHFVTRDGRVTLKSEHPEGNACLASRWLPMYFTLPENDECRDQKNVTF